MLEEVTVIWFARTLRAGDELELGELIYETHGSECSVLSNHVSIAYPTGACLRDVADFLVRKGAID